MTPSAIWCRRSPKRLIVPAIQNAENRASLARPTYGCSRIRSASGRRGTGIAAPAGIATARAADAAAVVPNPGPMPPPSTSGRSMPTWIAASHSSSRSSRCGRPRQRETTPSSASDRPCAIDENRNHAIPVARRTSPVLMTLARIGTGSGRMSPMGPACRRKSRPRVSGSATWKLGEKSAIVRPATSIAGTYTGMYPPFSAIAMPLLATPTIASNRPGCERLSQRAKVSRPKATTNSGSRKTSTMATPSSRSHCVPIRSSSAARMSAPNRTRTDTRLEIRPPAARPATIPARMPSSSTGQSFAWTGVRRTPGEGPGLELGDRGRRRQRRCPLRCDLAEHRYRRFGVSKAGVVASGRLELRGLRLRERVDDPWVELDTRVSPKLGECLRRAQGDQPIWTRRGHRLEGIRDMEDASEQRTLLADEPIRVPRAVEPLVVVADERAFTGQLIDFLQDSLRP